MKQWAGRVVAAAAVVVLLLTTGCAGFFVYPGSLPGGGSGTGTGTGTEFVYVINQTTGQNAGTLLGYSIGTGTLTPVSGSPQSFPFNPTAIAVNRTNTMVFVSGFSGANGFIYTYAIGSGGALSPLNSNNLATAVENAIDVSPDGQYLLGLHANGTTEALIDDYSINSSGVLTTASTPVVYSGQAIAPSAIKFAPANASGQLVFVALGTAGDLVYTFGSGALSSGPSESLAVPGLSSDLAVAVNPNGSTVYFARSSGTVGSVAAYSFSGTTVAQTPVSTLSAGDRPSAVVVNTAGTDVYVANEFDGTISGYSGAASGALTALNLAPYSVGPDPAALAVDHSGDYLLAVFATATGNNLSMYSYDTSGNLVSSTALNTGSNSTPIGLATTY